MMTAARCIRVMVAFSTSSRAQLPILGLLALSTVVCCSRNSDRAESSGSGTQPVRPLYQAVVGNKHGFVDATGQIVIPPEFDETLGFSGRLAAVRREDRWGFIDASGKFVINPHYDGISWGFSNG